MALLDHLGIDKIHVCGHSFGGLMASYLAYHHPERFERIVILDAAPQMNPKAAEMLGPALSRIDTRFTNFETYLETIRQAPYLHFWDPAMEAYYRADVATAADGSVEPISNLSDIIQIATHVSKVHWDTYFTGISHAVLLVVALDEYTLQMPLLPDQKAREIISRMQHATLREMHGNHQTMLFGDHARELVEMICAHL
jgi:pimeloyl-ACP methyl ester carboxylesterase